MDEATKEASLIGNTLGDRYRLIEVIGEGGMGRVYRAEQLATGKAVALKLLHPEFVGVEQVVRRFEREAKVMTEVAHPGIVKVIELGEWNGRLFLAMELLAGKSLAEQLVREGGQGGKAGKRLTVKRTLAIIRPVLEALEYAHALGVVHRDLKPENIMIIPGGLLSRESIKLLDFGIAKLGDRSVQASQKLTQHGMVLGTPAYMAPEQAAGQEADVRSDVYSCGIILYQLLTGHRPFEGEANIDVLLMHINTQPKSLREVADGAWIPDAVERVVLRALAKRPAQRYQSAAPASAGARASRGGRLWPRRRGRNGARPGADVGRFALPLPCDHRGGRDDAAGRSPAVAASVGREQRRQRRRPAPAPPRDGEKQAAPETGRPSPEPAKAKRRSAKHARSTSKRGAARRGTLYAHPRFARSG